MSVSLVFLVKVSDLPSLLLRWLRIADIIILFSRAAFTHWESLDAIPLLANASASKCITALFDAPAVQRGSYS